MRVFVGKRANFIDAEKGVQSLVLKSSIYISQPSPPIITQLSYTVSASDVLNFTVESSDLLTFSVVESDLLTFEVL